MNREQHSRLSPFYIERKDPTRYHWAIIAACVLYFACRLVAWGMAGFPVVRI